MAYEFDKMSINGTQIDAKDKEARNKITEMIPDLESTKTTAQNALNLATSQTIAIADNADNIETLRGNLQTVTDTVNQIVSDEYQELDYTLLSNFTLLSYGYITCIKAGTLAVISFFGLSAVNTSASAQEILSLNGYRAKKLAAAIMYNYTNKSVEIVRTNTTGERITANSTIANNNYGGTIIFPIEEV